MWSISLPRASVLSVEAGEVTHAALHLDLYLGWAGVICQLSPVTSALQTVCAF